MNFHSFHWPDKFYRMFDQLGLDNFQECMEDTMLSLVLWCNNLSGNQCRHCSPTTVENVQRGRLHTYHSCHPPLIYRRCNRCISVHLGRTQYPLHKVCRPATMNFHFLYWTNNFYMKFDQLGLGVFLARRENKMFCLVLWCSNLWGTIRKFLGQWCLGIFPKNNSRIW